MIGTIPATQIVPREYGYALDAAASLLIGFRSVRALCTVPQLKAEIEQRFVISNHISCDAALWVEPLEPNWRADLAAIAFDLPPSAPLIIIASTPLARLIPERKSWYGTPLGLSLQGLRQLRNALPDEKVHIERRIDIHCLASIVLNNFSLVASRCGLPQIADRLHFAARLHYTGNLGVVLMLQTRKVA